MLDLSQKYYQLLLHFDIKLPVIERYWQNLSAHYQQTHRHYHQFDHLQAMFEKLSTIQHHIQDIAQLEFAIFYHDVIYQTKNKNQLSNEQQSANYFLQDLQSYLPHDMTQNIVQFILATERHELLCSHPDLPYFLDLDLAILGEKPNIYKQYQQAIRAEYHHIPQLLYYIGRRKVLNHFLKRKRLYFTEVFYQNYEQQARQNIQNELAYF